MRFAFHLTLGMSFAAGGYPVVAQPAVPPASAEAEIAVRITLDPELDRKWPELRAAVSAGGNAVSPEQADYTLVADWLMPDYVELRPRHDGARDVSGNFPLRIGRASTGEAAQVLGKLLPLLQRQKALYLISERTPPAGVSFCKLDISPPHDCLDRDRSKVIGSMAETRIANAGPGARYVALFSVNQDLSIASIPLSADKKIMRLEPGRSLRVANPGTANATLSHEFLLVSDGPFDPSVFEQTSPSGRPGCGSRLAPHCFSEVAPLPSSAGFSAIRQALYNDEPLPTMGGGENAARGDSDWMVELYATREYTPQDIEDDRRRPPESRQYLAERTPEERAHACGGTIIAPDLVLTAAHCVATGRFLGENITRIFTDRRVRVGSLRMGKGGETKAIVGVAVHAGYSGVGSGLPNDIALLMVKSDERIRLVARPLPLASAPASAGSTLTGLGWGYTQSVAAGANVMRSMSGEIQRNPQILQQAPLEVLGNAKCQQRLPGRIKPGMICLVTPRAIVERGGPPTFSCRGDSGGPLVRNYGNGSEELVGLTSWSIGCGHRDTPSVYTDVFKFKGWIEAARRAIKAGQAIRVTEPARVR